MIYTPYPMMTNKKLIIKSVTPNNTFIIIITYINTFYIWDL